MAAVNSHAWVILATQWRMWLNFYRRHGRASFVLSLLFSAIWYGGFAGIAVFAANFFAQPQAIDRAGRALPIALFFAFGYWQGMPLVMASIGGMLDLKKLLVYPVAEKDLFRIELLMRTALFCEMPLVMAGLAIGLLRNPTLPAWCALAPILFAIFNIVLGAGLRDLIGRLFQKKRVREALIFGFILLAAVPAWLGSRGSIPPQLRTLSRELPTSLLPWAAAADASSNQGGWRPWVALGVVALLAWMFSRYQFRKSLNFDSDAQKAADSSRGLGILDRLLGWPAFVFRDPLGALVEKELRFLSRTSRFRIVFTMGFTFGLLIWLPMARGRAGGAPGWMGENFLTVVVLYALMLLSEVLFYNSFGFDRSAAQLYFLVPVRPATVVMAKNIAAVFFVAAEVSLVTVACLVLKMPVTWTRVGEAACVSAVMMLFLLGIGNLGSTRSPRALNPSDGWKRAAASKFSFLAFLLYPLILSPVALAYLARYAFGTQQAFFVAMAGGIFIAACFYYVSLDSAVQTLDRDRERFLTLLTQTDTPAF